MLQLCACSGTKAGGTWQGKLDLFGVELYSGTDYRELRGSVATEEACLKGFERSFDQLDISIGYGFDRTIRKITTRNRTTTIFGIKPGMKFDEARQILRQNGLAATGSPFRFQGDRVSISMLVDNDGQLFGITIETDD